jgi:hypothetical protein
VDWSETVKSVAKFSLLAVTLLLGTGVAMARATKPYAGSANDFLEISQLFARYNTAVDNRDGENWAATFTPDGVFQDARRCIVGRAALSALLGPTAMPGRDRERFHMQSLGPIVYTSRSAASVRSAILVVESPKADETTGTWTTAIAEDDLQRVDGRWLIARRIIHQGLETQRDKCR